MESLDTKAIEADLFGGLHVHFSEQQRKEIVELFRAKYTDSQPAGQNQEIQRKIWVDLVTEFHRSNYWGFVPSKSKPIEAPKPPTVARQIAVYFWTAFQALIVLKVIIYFFGLRVAQDNTLENWIYLIVAVAFSWGSLGFFAWRKHRDPTWKNQEPPQNSSS
jgi:hypothetical protein